MLLVDPAGEVGVCLDSAQDPVPGAVRRPPPVPFIDGLPAAETLGKVSLGYARSHPDRIPLITWR